ncbi:microfibril-associated glycoprotein 4-like [Pollicipes pollicipes]|uniref:microfibril-associated glycoprotein 4-like n=1 Tax=Pollicipes pollicipes TaxID=41117 RepID=UPI001884F308|nr:microfibril-associated glycoprotein 4-like [Pollicipes pollicipes]
MFLLRSGAAIFLLVVLGVPAPCDGLCCHSLAGQVADLNRMVSELSAAVNSAVLPRLTDMHAQMRNLTLQRQTCAPLVHSEPLARDCSDLPTGSPSGVYRAWLSGLPRPVPVYCDMSKDGGRWTVFQRRADITPRQNFYLNWQSYRTGFGKLDGEFWWGNEHLFRLTSQGGRRYQLRINLEDFKGGKRYALYWTFKIGPESDGYRLHVSGYEGNAGDSFRFHNNQRFSTYDRNNQRRQRRNCAQSFKGAWWYRDCHHSNLNGRYLSGPHKSFADGIEWLHWTGHHYSLKAVEMKIRPVKK